jgi:hypothetical protein
MLNNSVAYEKAYKFAIRIVRAFKHLQEKEKEFVLSKQMLRSGTSIGQTSPKLTERFQMRIFQAK